MKRGERILLGFVAVAFLLGLGGAGALLFESRGKDAGGGHGGGVEPPPSPPAETRPPADDGTVPTGLPRVEPPKPPVRSNLPLVEVVVRRQKDPYAASDNRAAPPRESGRTASLDGLVTDLGGSPVRGARLRFSHGLNAEEEATTDAEGRYAFAKVYPGAQLLEVEIPGTEAVLREVRLFPGRAERANFHLAAPLDVQGQVVDRRGKPVAGAEIRIDRRTASTDEEGRFVAVAITPGEAIAYVRAKGFAPLRVPLGLAPGVPPDRDRLRFVLEGAGTLRGETRGSSFEAGPPYLALVPDTPPIDRSFPFEDFGRIEVPANAPFEVPGVPLRKLLRVRAFHPLGWAKPPMRTVFLREDGDRNLVPVEFQFVPLRPLRGRVLDGETGKPFPGATVALEVADLLRETLGALPGAGGTLTAYVVTAPPDLRSTAKTDVEGRFGLGTGEGTGWRWLEVSAGGYRTLERAVGGGKIEVADLVLFREEAFAKGGELVLRFRRPEERRVALTLNGSAKEEEEVAAEATYVLRGLAPGIYEVRVKGGGRVLFAQADVPIGLSREIPLSD
ncbi:MAG TPA: carboxypeptidase-like regulatory domain-containing protein [Planctomycetota bacterium]|jgi:hypothetical protein|nr:carboxypeptidase-like regulatory domain-containing protein [Planctomycetota bacterium]